MAQPQCRAATILVAPHNSPPGRGGTAELIASGSWKQYLDSLGIAWDAPLDPSPPASQVPPALPT